MMTPATGIATVSQTSAYLANVALKSSEFQADVQITVIVRTMSVLKEAEVTFVAPVVKRSSTMDKRTANLKTLIFVQKTHFV